MKQRGPDNLVKKRDRKMDCRLTRFAKVIRVGVNLTAPTKSPPETFELTVSINIFRLEASFHFTHRCRCHHSSLTDSAAKVPCLNQIVMP